MPLIVRVVSHGTYDVGHIESVNLMFRTDNVILLWIDMKTKQRDVRGCSAGEGNLSFWIGQDEVLVTLPKDFGRAMLFAQTDRYSVYVCIYRFAILEKMINSQIKDISLWESNNG